MTADSGRWRRLRAIFDELVELDPGEQEVQLAQITFRDPELRAEVEALLLAERAAGDRFERPLPFPGELDDDGGSEESAVGQKIGPYRLSREIGRGGMGTVYEAFRDDAEFSKRVAIKMVEQAPER